MRRKFKLYTKITTKSCFGWDFRGTGAISKSQNEFKEKVGSGRDAIDLGA